MRALRLFVLTAVLPVLVATSGPELPPLCASAVRVPRASFDNGLADDVAGVLAALSPERVQALCSVLPHWTDNVVPETYCADMTSLSDDRLEQLAHASLVYELGHPDRQTWDWRVTLDVLRLYADMLAGRIGDQTPSTTTLADDVM